jgi:DNA-binding NarL/FixJ family response regulator
MIRIIIAESHQIIREGLKLILKNESDFMIIAEAQNWIQVLQTMQNHIFDLLLLDIDMPGKKGLELINELKEINPQMPVLALSIHPEDKFALSVLKAGASGYLCIDSAFDELVTAIRRIYIHGRYLSETLMDQVAVNIMPVNKSKPHEQLSNRELETMYMLVSGKRVKDIANELALSMSTVFTYRCRVFEKLKIKNNVQLIHYAIDNELIEMKSVLT